MQAERVPVRLPYGDGHLTVRIPNLLGLVEPRPCPAVADEARAVREALASPLGTPPLARLAAGRRDAIIVVNDHTRPYPGALLVREIAAVLNAAGIADSSITVLVACGVHRPQDREGLAALYGEEILSRFRVVNHNARDPEGNVSLGVTDGGVEVRVNRLYAEASLRITTGLITPHHSAGYSGGRKSIVPGIAGAETLRKHHSLPIRPFHPAMGRVQGNPFHEQALKAARIARVDFIVNTVPNARKQTAAVVAGDLEQAWLEGTRVCKAIWTVTLPSKADVVVTSPGGYPRDMNLQQAQKAVSSAELMCRPGGVIILCAECRNGLDADYARHLKDAATPQEVIDAFRRDGFDLGTNAKAFQLARAVQRFKVFVAGAGSAPGELERMFMRGFADAQQAVDAALAELGAHASFLVCPVAHGLIIENRQDRPA